MIVDYDDIKSILDLPEDERKHYFVNGFVDYIFKQLILVRATGQVITVPFSWFTSVNKKVDFTLFSIVDCGQTIQLGAEEASSRSILRDFDKEYNRWCIENTKTYNHNDKTAETFYKLIINNAPKV